MTNFFITLFLGWAGIHKFMDKKIGMGILYLFTFGLFGVGWIYDIFKSGKATFFPNHEIIIVNAAGTYYYTSEIASLLSRNPKYELSNDLFIEEIPSSKIIFKYFIRNANASLIPEPTNPHDPDAIKIIVDDMLVGYVPAHQCPDIKKVLKRIKSVSAKIYGGNYKYHSNDEVFTSESSFSIQLTISV